MKTPEEYVEDLIFLERDVAIELIKSIQGELLEAIGIIKDSMPLITFGEEGKMYHTKVSEFFKKIEIDG